MYLFLLKTLADVRVCRRTGLKGGRGMGMIGVYWAEGWARDWHDRHLLVRNVQMVYVVLR